MRQTNRKNKDISSIFKNIMQLLSSKEKLKSIFSTKRARIIGLAAAVVAVALIVTLIVMPSSEEKEAEAYLDSIENMDDETLAGLRGDDSAFEEDKGDHSRVAVLSGSGMESLLKGIETDAERELSSATIDDYYIYITTDDENQLIQDMRSIVNKGCKSVILIGLNEHMFSVACGIAEDNGIAVIALDAPAEGYSLNIKRYDASGDNAAFTGGAAAFEHSGTGAAEKFKAYIIENGMPKFCCVDASPEFLKLWQSLSTTGIMLEKTEADGTVTSSRYARGECRLYARIATSGASIGETLMRAASLKASGKEIKSNEFTMPKYAYITNETFQEYYQKYSESTSKLIYENVEASEVDAVFSEVTK